MRFVIEDAGFWKSCVSAIANIVDDGVFVASKEGISLKAIDPSGISMVSFTLPKEALQQYEIKETEELGVSFEDLEKVTSRLRNGEKLEVKKEGNSLLMNFGKRGRVKLSLIESTNKVEKDPEYGRDAEVTISAYDFKEMLKDASIFSSQVTFKVADNNFSIFAKSENGEIEESCEENTIKEIKINEKESKATFSLEFLNDIIKACPDEANIKLAFGSDKPIKIEYTIGKANFIYYLAPIVEQ
jgi:proliferating cell nuclear antigen